MPWHKPQQRSFPSDKTNILLESITVNFYHTICSVEVYSTTSCYIFIVDEILKKTSNYLISHCIHDYGFQASLERFHPPLT